MVALSATNDNQTCVDGDAHRRESTFRRAERRASEMAGASGFVSSGSATPLMPGSALPPLFCCCSGKNSVPTAADGFGLADTGQYVSCCGGPRLFAEARRAHAASYANDLGPQSQLATAEAALLHAPSVKMRPIPYGKVWTAKAVASAMCCSMKLAAPPSAITSHVLLGQSVTDLRRALCSSPEAPQSPSSFLA